MDIKQAVDARAALTLGKDMVFRDYAQGAFRMRGIGKGQTIILLVTPEVVDLIGKHVSIGATGKIGAPNIGDVNNTAKFLKDVLSWLVINSMRVDSVQYNLLCEQSVSNIWRKRCFKVLQEGYRDIDSADRASPQAIRALKVFRERLVFEIENSIPTSTKYSDKIRQMIESHGDLLAAELDRKTADYILHMIREEEAKNEQLKKQAAAAAAAIVEDAGPGEAATEQSFNREQVQEQEQVSIFSCFRTYYHSLLTIPLSLSLQEQEQEQEQEKEKEKEEEKVDEIEEEEFIKQRYARDDEEAIPWEVDQLSYYPTKGKLGFYPLSQFSIFQNYSKANETLKFPDFLWVSRNSYQQAWSLTKTLRRLKNVIMILEWTPSIRDKDAILPTPIGTTASTVGSFITNLSKSTANGGGVITVDQENMLLRCFNMFDLDEDGLLSTEEITKVIGVMGLDAVTAEFAQIKYVDLIAAKGGFTFGVFKEMIKDIANQFRNQDGKFYVLLSLQEAEHFRGLLHSRLNTNLISSETGGIDMTSAALWLISDSDAVLMESTKKTYKPSFGSQHGAMVSCYRFMNSETYFDPVGLTVLLRVLEMDTCEQREKWWYDIRRCRRRRQIPLDGSFPVVTVFNTKDELSYMEYKAVIKRVQAGLQDKGMLIFDAFRAFNSSRSGCLSCSELYGAMDFLGIAFTPAQIYDLVKKIAVQNEVSCCVSFCYRDTYSQCCHFSNYRA